MRVLVRYLGGWGLGDLLCSDPLMLGLVERYGPDTEIRFAGHAGNVAHNPLVRGPAPAGFAADVTVDVTLFTHMPVEDYARLEALPSLIDHMCSYGSVRPSDRRPRLHLSAREAALPATLGIDRLPEPRIAICADYVDPLRHWPVDRWRAVARCLADAGARVLEVGSKDRLGVGADLVGRLTVRQTAAVLGACNLFLGNNSGLFHYAQAAGVPCVVLFSLATPSRFFHPGARVVPLQVAHLPCIDCMTRRFAAMQVQGCIAAPRGRCMLEISVSEVLEAVDACLATTREMRGEPQLSGEAALPSPR